MVTRSDLTPGLQAAQAVHAAFQFSMAHPEIVSEWVSSSNFLVVVAVEDEDSLLNLAATAIERGLVIQVVREPDLDDAVTAIAIEPGDPARRLCSALPLALREKVMA